MKIFKYLLSFFLVFYFTHATAQREFIRMSSQVNHPANNNFFPFISGDGLTIIYSSDYTDYSGPSMFESSKTGGLWQEGTEMTRLVNRPDLNLDGGYSLNFDGTFLIITSRKHGLGGFELWYSEKRNGNWSETRNFGAPVNSSMHEGAGVLSPDEQEMYFMRCQKMNEQTASGCKIYLTKRKNNRWIEPVALPENINSFNPQMPRILGDDQTLIFSSDKPGGKGGFDLYMTRKTADGWTDPVNLEFANTPNDDKYASVPARGRYLYVARPGERKSEIVQLLLPDDFRPKPVLKITGKVVMEDAETTVVEGIVFDAVNRKTFSRFPVDESGAFAISLPEGTTYDVSFNPVSADHWYASRLYELDTVPTRNRESLKIELKKLKPDTPILNENLIFEAHSDKIEEISSFELRRLTSLLRAHPEYKIEVVTHLYNYLEDSTNTNPDLTEIRYDTIYEKITEIIPEQYLSTSIKDTLLLDTLITNGTVLYNEEDTLMVMVEEDSIYFQNLSSMITIPALREVVITTYHNDRTKKEAEAIKAELTSRGIEEDRIIIDYKVYRASIVPEKQKEREVEIILRAD